MITQFTSNINLRNVLMEKIRECLGAIIIINITARSISQPATEEIANHVIRSQYLSLKMNIVFLFCYCFVIAELCNLTPFKPGVTNI